MSTLPWPCVSLPASHVDLSEPLRSLTGLRSTYVQNQNKREAEKKNRKKKKGGSSDYSVRHGAVDGGDDDTEAEHLPKALAGAWEQYTSDCGGKLRSYVNVRLRNPKLGGEARACSALSMYREHIAPPS